MNATVSEMRRILPLLSHDEFDIVATVVLKMNLRPSDERTVGPANQLSLALWESLVYLPVFGEAGRRFTMKMLSPALNRYGNYLLRDFEGDVLDRSGMQLFALTITPPRWISWCGPNCNLEGVPDRSPLYDVLYEEKQTERRKPAVWMHVCDLAQLYCQTYDRLMDLRSATDGTYGTAVAQSEGPAAPASAGR